MTEHGESALAEFVAQHIDARSTEILDQWADSRGRSPAMRTMPRPALRDSVRALLSALALYVRAPAGAWRPAMLAPLRPYVQMRRDQGCCLHDLLADVDALAQHVQSDVDRAVLGHPADWPLREILAIHGRVAQGLREIAVLSADAYREAEQMRAVTLARHLSEFGRTLSHELRSPMQAILMAASALRDDDSLSDPARCAEQSGVVDAAVRRAAGLLDDVNLLAAIETARTRPRMQPVAEMIADVRRETHHLAQRQEVQLTLAGPPETVAVEATVGQLVLMSLVGNAIKYHDRRKDVRRVRVTTTRDESGTGPRVLFEVADNGLGIPDACKSRVFRRNFTAHPQVAGRSGLSLAICRALLAERGCRLELESSPGVGSTFRFTLHAVDAPTRCET